MHIENSSIKDSVVHGAVELGKERSGKNLEYMHKSFLFRAMPQGALHKTEQELGSELDEKAKILRPEIRISYRRQIADAFTILNEGRIKNLAELPHEQQVERRKSERPLEDVMRERQEIERALGWAESDQIYHFLVDTDDRAKRAMSPGYDYGGVRLVFDLDDFGDQATFTVGDSLNPRGIPPGLVRDSQDKVRSAIERQICKEDVPIAEVILESTGVEEGRFEGHLKYIEAQVCIPDQSEIMSKLKKVVVYEQHATTDKRSTNTEGGEDSFTAMVSRLRLLCEVQGIHFEFIPVPSEDFVVPENGVTTDTIAQEVLKQRGRPGDTFAVYSMVKDIQRFNPHCSDSSKILPAGTVLRVPLREDLSKSI